MTQMMENCLRSFPRRSGSWFSSTGQRTPWNPYLSRESGRNLSIERTKKTQEKDLHLRIHIENSTVESLLEVGPHLISRLVIQSLFLLCVFKKNMPYISVQYQIKRFLLTIS